MTEHFEKAMSREGSVQDFLEALDQASESNESSIDIDEIANQNISDDLEDRIALQGISKRIRTEGKKMARYMKNKETAKAERARIRIGNLSNFLKQKEREATQEKLSEFKEIQREKFEQAEEEREERLKDAQIEGRPTLFPDNKKPIAKEAFNKRLNPGE